MTEEFNLREQIVVASHRWPIFLLFCLTGCLIGWGVSLIWPSPVRATKELYVGINIYQPLSDSNAESFAGVRFINADDYKNWQMANLNALVYMDEIIDPTLLQLQAIDPFWQEITRKQLKKALHVYWRNAGKWRLVGESDDRLHASQAVAVWQTVVIDRVNRAVEAAQNLQVLDQQINGITNSLIEHKSQKAETFFFLETLQSRRKSLQNHPIDKPLRKNERWSIWQPVAQANLDTIWPLLSEEFPEEKETYQEYLPWLDRAEEAIDSENLRLEAEIDQLEGEKINTVKMYSQASQTSLGLSPNLEVETITSDAPQISIIRPTSQLILIGMFLGLISWIGYWLAIFALKAKK